MPMEMSGHDEQVLIAVHDSKKRMITEAGPEFAVTTFNEPQSSSPRGCKIAGSLFERGETSRGFRYIRSYRQMFHALQDGPSPRARTATSDVLRDVAQGAKKSRLARLKTGQHLRFFDGVHFFAGAAGIAVVS